MNVLNVQGPCLDGAAGLAAQVVNLLVYLGASKRHVDGDLASRHVVDCALSEGGMCEWEGVVGGMRGKVCVSLVWSRSARCIGD